jgi:hypothetical protein
VADSFCLTYVGPEPATVQDCKPINCFAWQTDVGWGTCSVSCSSGTQNRGVWCQDTTLNQLGGSPADCSPQPKPATQTGCGLPCTNNFLDSFSISNQVSFPFTPTQQVYTVNVPSHITTSTGTAARQDPLATMTWNIQTVSGLVYPTTQPIQVTVRSEAGVDRVYTVNVYRLPSTNAFLGSLTPSTGAWAPALSLTSTFTYTLTVANVITSVSFTATQGHVDQLSLTWSPSSTVGPTLPVWPSQTITVITGHAQDGVTTQAYTIIVERLRSSISTLAGLTITALSTARLFPTFATATPSYTLSGRLGPDILDVIITASLTDGTATLSYTVQHETGSVGPVSFAPATAISVSIFQGEQTLIIRVLAQDLATESIYTCTFSKVSSESRLQSMSQTVGWINTPVVPDTHTYTLTVPFSATEITVGPAMKNQFATGVYSFQGTSAKFSVSAPIPPLPLTTVGDFTLELRITSEDLSTFTEYVLTIHRQSNDGVLALLNAPQADFTEPFQVGMLSYTLNLASTITSLTLQARPAYSFAILEVKVGSAAYVALAGTGSTVTVIAADHLAYGDMTVLIRVTAEDLTPGTVTTLTVHRLSSQATLTGIINTAGAIATTAVLDYSITVDVGVMSFNLQPVPTSDYALINI